MGIKHKDVIEEVFDANTGEIKQFRRTQSYKAKSEPSFVKLYIEDVCRLNNLSPSAMKLLMSLVKRIGYDSVITLHAKAKSEICKEMGIKSAQTIENKLPDLINCGIIKRVCRGSFMLNPDYFAKGQWNDVKKLRDAYSVVMEVSYSNEGRKIKTNLKTGVKEEDGRHFIDDEMGTVELN